jgi:catechol 2,3-dioxygenase-like lactoylglutathione lyase family enzyme
LVGETVVVVADGAVDDADAAGGADDVLLLQAVAVSTSRATIELPRVLMAAFFREDGVMSFISRVTIVVDDYDPAIAFFVDVLGFELVEDSTATTNDGRVKRWVVVRPPGAETGVLLARADGDQQSAVVGRQTAGRVGFFFQVDDFDATYARMLAAHVEIVGEPRTEPYGRVVVFVDIAGNRWDLLGA